MKRVFLTTSVVVAVLSCSLVASPSSAATRHEVYNGATCIPYPPFNSENAVPYSYWLYGLRQSAYCHITMSNEWEVTDLSYVLYSAHVSSGTLAARLCVYSTSSYSCGTSTSITPSGIGVNWVAPPGSKPSGVSGAYLHLHFPTNQISVFKQYMPVWNK